MCRLQNTTDVQSAIDGQNAPQIRSWADSVRKGGASRQGCIKVAVVPSGTKYDACATPFTYGNLTAWFGGGWTFIVTRTRVGASLHSVKMIPCQRSRFGSWIHLQEPEGRESSI